MPCITHPTESQRERQILNAEAKPLLDWLDRLLTKNRPELDPTGLLCTKIRGLGEKEFRELMVNNIDNEQARELLGWWERHKKYDEKHDRGKSRWD